MSHYGIDVSHWQGSIDWRQVAASGKEFAIIKATEGTGWTDTNYYANAKGARNVGLTVGAYHYFRGGWPVEAQVEHFASHIDLQAGDLIPWIDVEDLKQSMNGPSINPEQFTRELMGFLAECDARFGVKVGIYTGLWFWDNLPYTGRMDRPLWVAYWYSDQQPGDPILPNDWDTYAIHQYTSRGTVPGIRGHVDLDWMPGNIETLRYGGGQSPPGADVRVYLNDIRATVNEIEQKLYGGIAHA